MVSPDLPSLIRAGLPGHAWWVIYLRYGCAVAVFFCTLFLTQSMGAKLNVTPLFAIAGALLASNILYSLHLSQTARYRGAVSPAAAARSLTLQNGMDLFLLTLMLHFSGGVTNPLMALYVGPILLAGFLLSVRATYALAGLAAMLYGGMAVLEYRHLIPHVPVSGLFPPSAYKSEAYVMVVLTAFVLVVGLAAVLSLTVSGRLRGPDVLGDAEKDSKP